MNKNKRRIGVLAGLGMMVLVSLFLNRGRTVFAQQEKEEGVLYSNDFEKKDDISSTPSTNTKYNINFKGLSEEQAHSGKKSFKIDVTVKGGSFCYWQRNLRIPLTENITFSGYLFYPAEGKGTLPPPSLRFMVVFPKAQKTEEGKYVVSSGCRSLPAVSGISPSRWCQFFSDRLYETAKNSALSRGFDYTDMYISAWYVSLTDGGAKTWKAKEERIVVYVDDVSISREEPEEEEGIY